MSSLGVKKPRNRVPVSCEECRKKKMKCDKQKPCSSCVKSGCADSCTYIKDSIKPVVKRTPKKANLKAELLKMKMKMNMMEKVMKANNLDLSSLADDEALFDKYTNKDEDEQISTLLNKFDTMIIKENNVFRSGLVTCVALVQKDKQIHSLISPFNTLEQTQFSNYLSKQMKKASDFKLGTTTMEMLEQSQSVSNCVTTNSIAAEPEARHQFIRILDEINTILPPTHIFNVLIERFFEYVYHFLPFVNKEVFLEEVSRVLVLLPDGNTRLGVTHYQNASIVSLLLMVLRFAYMTTPSDYLLDGEAVSAKYPQLAKCLIESITGVESVEHKFNLRTIQVYLYLKCYDSYFPSAHSYVSSAMKTNKLIAMARIYGIFRDPSYFDNTIHTDKRLFDVIRRIAFKLFLIDWQTSFDSGSHLILFDNEVDVKLPQLEKKEKEVLAAYKRGDPTSYSQSEIDKLLVEQNINSDTMMEYEVSLLVRKCFNIAQMHNRTASKRQLSMAVNELERFTEDKIPHIYDLIQWKAEKHSFVRILELRKCVIQFLTTINYLLVTNEEINDPQQSELLDSAIVKTTEYSLQYFKFMFDYAYYCKCKKDSSQVNTSNLNLFKTLKSFSRNLDSLILTFMNRGFMHAICWLGSLFYRSAKTRVLNLDTLFEKFENNTDSTNVLQWFLCHQGWNSSRTLNDQFPFILFTYLKQLFITLSALKGDNFDCQKNWLMIKVFVKSAKIYEAETYEVFIKNEFSETLNDNAEDEDWPLPEFLGVQKIVLNESEKAISKDLELDFLDQSPFDVNNFYQKVMEEVDLNGIDLSEIPFIKDMASVELPMMDVPLPVVQSSSGISSSSFSPLDANDIFQDVDVFK